MATDYPLDPATPIRALGAWPDATVSREDDDGEHGREASTEASSGTGRKPGMSPERRRDKSRGHLAFRAVAAFVAFVTLVAVLRAGSSYVYCPSMQRVMDAPCCSGDSLSADDDEADGDTAPALRSRDCCEHHVLGRLPSVGSLGSAPHLLASPILAVLPAPTVACYRSAPFAALRLHHEGRAGPMESARHRAELMVSLN